MLAGGPSDELGWSVSRSAGTRGRWTGAHDIHNLHAMASGATSRTDRSSLARTAAVGAGVLLGAIGVLHAVWAVGSTWPFSNKERLSQVVWGAPASTFPSSAATWAVVILIGIAVLVLTGQAGLWGARIPGWVFSLGSWGIAAVLILRALRFGGAAIGSDAINRTWELALFTPLCLVIGVLCVTAASNGSRSRAQQP